jgi:LacI family transcriptional regulator
MRKRVAAARSYDAFALRPARQSSRILPRYRGAKNNVGRRKGAAVRLCYGAANVIEALTGILPIMPDKQNDHRPDRLSRARSGKKRAAVTLQDVARTAGVSVMTVSNVVNERFDSMRTETRERVEKAIRKLKYRPHSIARGLRSASSLTVGFLILDQAGSLLTEPFIMQITAGLSAVLGEGGYGLLVHGISDANMDNVVFLRSGRTDAICVFLSGSDRSRRDVIKQLALLDEPMIIFQELAPPAIDDYCVVRQTDFEGGRSLSRHVIQRGARHAIVLGPDIVWPGASQRVAGMMDAFASKGPSTCKLVSCRDGRLETIRAALVKHVTKNSHPDAILTVNDRMGLSTIRVLQELGLAVPGDVKVTGYNAIDFWQYPHPTLTTVESRPYDMGQAAGRALLERFSRGQFPKREIVLPVSLKVGDST